MGFITAHNIYKSYGSVQALTDISFSVEKNELFGFIGPDGAGKTSLFRIIATLLLPTTGTLNIDSWDVVKDYRTIRKNIGYMPGRFSLYQDLSVEENLNFFATIFGTTIHENYDLVKDIYVQIEPFKKRLAGQLSGGMKQKLALSCALIHKPELLVLDEPTTGVDAVSRKEFWEMLKSLRNKGITIVVSTPYMDEASLCDRVALMQDGKIMQIDSPQGIVDKFPKRLFAIRSDNMYKLKDDLQHFNECHSVHLFGQYLHVTGVSNDISPVQIGTYAQSKDHTNIQVEEIKPGIEDCFIALMTENAGTHEK
jgi:ABC-type multidrug transport system ATPase subunit